MLLAGPRDADHPQGTHEYDRDIRLITHAIENSNVSGLVECIAVFDSWPEDESLLDRADTIVLFGNGADRNLQEHAFGDPSRQAVIDRQMKRGCGLVVIHWPTIVPNNPLGDHFLDWIGGHFDHQSNPDDERGWYSRIDFATTMIAPGTAAETHEVWTGVQPFSLTDEYYYRLRFKPNDDRFADLIRVNIPDDNDAPTYTVGWGVQRADGGRGFGFTGGHFIENWWDAGYRKLMLNAIVWSAGVAIPAGGVESTLQEPRRVALLTGHDHPAHDWQNVSPALKQVIEGDPRMSVEVFQDPHAFLNDRDLEPFDLLVLNFCNWQKGGLTSEAQQKLISFVEAGGGIAVIHFANGAFHWSLPNAGWTDWPEYREKISRRVWQAGISGHDNFGPFTVQITDHSHPITQGLSDFQTRDELYFRQQGQLPIHVLATAHSAVTDQQEPMAWVFETGKGRVFQTVLGHAPESVQAASQLMQQGATWASGLSALTSQQ